MSYIRKHHKGARCSFHEADRSHLYACCPSCLTFLWATFDLPKARLSGCLCRCCLPPEDAGSGPLYRCIIPQSAVTLDHTNPSKWFSDRVIPKARARPNCRGDEAKETSRCRKGKSNTTEWQQCTHQMDYRRLKGSQEAELGRGAATLSRGGWGPPVCLCSVLSTTATPVWRFVWGSHDVSVIHFCFFNRVNFCARRFLVRCLRSLFDL